VNRLRDTPLRRRLAGTLVGLALVSVLSLAVVNYFVVGTLLQTGVEDKLELLRDQRQAAISEGMEQLAARTAVLAEDPGVVAAFVEMSDAYRDLPDFVKNTLVAALPEPGVWFQFRILESKEDTRILQRPTARIGDTELSGQRLARDGQRYNEHKFKMTLGPLTSRFIQISADVKESRGAGFKLLANGAPSDHGWVVSVPAGSRSGAKLDARRIAPDGLHLSGLGREHAALWVAVFNPDPAADRRCELSVFLRKDTKSPFRTKG
jgi:hypothetical protein